MRKSSVVQAGRTPGPRTSRVTRPISPRDLEQRLRARKLPPIVLILISLALWILIGFSCYAIVKALG